MPTGTVDRQIKETQVEIGLEGIEIKKTGFCCRIQGNMEKYPQQQISCQKRKRKRSKIFLTLSLNESMTQKVGTQAKIWGKRDSMK